jgi:ketol-acid reductoisomerase
MIRAQQRIDEYETAAAESDMLALLTTDRSKEAVYRHVAGHLRDLACGFRETLGFGGEINPGQVAAPRIVNSD